MDANRTTPGYELKDELARLCLPPASQDSELKLAWVNSVCILFLIIGILGARRGLISIKPVPPIEEVVPTIVEPMTLPPQEMPKKQEKREMEKSDTPQAVVVTLESPKINFVVPTIGTLVVPTALASAPPLEPLEAAAEIGSLNNTGAGGERPEPPYPPMAKETGEQGTVILLLGGDAAGNVISVDVKESSGFPVLDRASADFIKHHWHLPAGAGNRLFQVPITYELQLN